MDAEAVRAIQQRYGFSLPELYLNLLSRGHFSVVPWDNYLSLSDCEWLSLPAIAEYKFLSFQIQSLGGFVPFAVTPRGDEYCWKLDWITSSEPAVVFCERGETGFGFAASFQGFLYRQTLEIFAGVGSPENEKGLRELRRSADILTPFLPSEWSGYVKELSAKPLSEWQTGKFGEKFLIAKAELQCILESQLAFEHLNERFSLCSR